MGAACIVVADSRGYWFQVTRLTRYSFVRSNLNSYSSNALALATTHDLQGPIGDYRSSGGERELIPIAFLRAIRQPLHAVTGDAAAPTWLVAEVMAVSKNKKSDTTIGPTRLRTSKECVKAIRIDTLYANAG